MSQSTDWSDQLLLVVRPSPSLVRPVSTVGLTKLHLRIVGWSCYDFDTLAPKQALTLSDITLSFLSLPTVTLSCLSIYFYSYIFLSFRSSPTSPYITLSLHFTSDHSASDSLSPTLLPFLSFPPFRLLPCKDNHFVFKPLASPCIL